MVFGRVLRGILREDDNGVSRVKSIFFSREIFKHKEDRFDIVGVLWGYIVKAGSFMLIKIG